MLGHAPPTENHHHNLTEDRTIIMRGRCARTTHTDTHNTSHYTHTLTHTHTHNTISYTRTHTHTTPAVIHTHSHTHTPNTISYTRTHTHTTPSVIPGVGNLLYQKSRFGISPIKKKSFGAANFFRRPP